MRFMNLITLCLALFAVIMCVEAEDGPSERLRSGKTLVEALQQRRSLNSAGQSLRQVVVELQDNTGIAVCLDRRTDPSAVVEVSTQYVSTRAILESLATTKTETGVSFADQYVMIGPGHAVSRLRTLTALRRQDVQALRRQMKSEKYRTLVEARKVSWSDLMEPRQLLIDGAVRAGVEIENPGVVPHDLWASAELPAVPFADLASLILNQFDLTFDISAEGLVTIVAVPDAVVIEQRHRVPSRDQGDVLLRWKAAFPDFALAFKGSTATVMATVETHERLRELIRGGGATAVAAGGLTSRLFTLKVQKVPFGALVAELRKQGIPIRIEGMSGPELTEVLQKTAAFDLAKSPSTEFFPRVFAGSGAKVTVTDEEVVLTFAE